MMSDHASTRLALGLTAAALLLLPLVYHPDLGTPDLLPKRMLLYALGLGTSAAWLWAALSGASSWIRTPLSLPTGAYALINLLSLAWANNPFSGLVEAAQILVLVLLTLGLIALLRPHHILPLAQFSALGGLLVSVIGIAQYLGLGFENIPSVGLPSGTFIFRNLAASYLIGAIPLGLLALLLDPRSLRKILWGVCTAAMALFLVYTRTRGAWVGLAGAFILALLLLLVQPAVRKALRSTVEQALSARFVRGGLALCILVLLIGVALPSRTSKKVIQRFDEQKSTALTAAATILISGGGRGRTAMWKHTLRMIADRPLLGVGLDNWEFAYPPYDQGDKITSAAEPVRPHNDFLWIASELGLVGFCIYLWLLVTAARTGLRLLRTGTPETQAIVLASAVGLAALLGHSLFSFPKEQPASAALFWFHLTVLGLLSARREPPAATRRTAWAVPCLALLLSIGALTLNGRQIAFDRHFFRARMYEEARRWLAGYNEISLALTHGTFDHRARFLQARFLHRAGRTTEAEAAYRRALEAHPNYAHTHHNLGGIYTAQKKWAKAIASYLRALEIRPNYFQARIHLGNAYVATGRLDAAARAFETVLRQSPESAEAHGNLGAVYVHLGDLDRAIVELREAIRFRPDHAEAYNNLAYAYEQTGRYPEAAAAYEGLLQHWKGDAAYRETVRRHLEALRSRPTPEE